MATAEAQEAPVQVGTVTFEAKGDNYCIIRQDAIVAMSPQGQAYEAKRAEKIDFAPTGRVTLREGSQVLADGPVLEDDQGRMLMDDHNQPKREQQDAITYLLRHRDFGVWFWVKGLKPGTALPLEETFLDAVMEAQYVLNLTQLRRLREAELRSHGRPVLLMTVDNAIRRVEVEREALGDGVPPEEEMRMPHWNQPGDLVRPVKNAQGLEYASADYPEPVPQPDNPAYAGGVR